MSKCADIIKRLEEATGPDRIVDWCIADALDIPEKWPESTLCPPFMKGSEVDKQIPLFSSSIDAAITLVECLMPDANFTLERRFRTTDGRVSGHMLAAHVSGGDYQKGPTLAIAILLSLFRALEAKEDAA